MKNLIFLIACFFALIFQSCAKNEEESPCGDEKRLTIFISNASLLDTASDYYNTYMEGSNRVFQWSQIAEQVCTDKHISTNFKVVLTDPNAAIQARGRLSWQFFYEDEVLLSKDGTNLSESTETGLRSAFSGLEGWFVSAVEVYFPSYGTYSADSAYLRENVTSAEAISDYRYYKE